MQISNAKIKPKELVQISLKTKDLNIVENRISLKDIKYKKLLSYVIKKKRNRFIISEKDFKLCLHSRLIS